jgi:hypothetical protein
VVHPHHHHDHGHDHGRGHPDHGRHDHGRHGHGHAAASFDLAFAVGVVLNTVFVVVEAGFGLASHSLALLADAGHNLSDVAGLLLAWGAVWLARRQPTATRTYGYGRTTILAALANAVLLSAAIGAIAWEAVGRFSAPEATHLLFVDADIGFAPADAFRLLESGKDVVAAVCPLKSIDWEKVRAAAKAGAADLMAAGLGYVVRFLPTADNSVEVDDGFARVAYAGTGFLMLRREALRRVADAHPELAADLSELGGPAPTVMVFDTLVEPGTGHYLSEDYAFCRRWRDLGGEVWADVEARLTHVGHAAYTGRLMDALKAT